MKHLSILILFLIAGPVVGQNFPVQLNFQLIPPYSPYLPDYCALNNDNIQIQLLLTDLSEPWLDIKLKIEILGNGFTIRTNPAFNPSPIRLEAGMPTAVEGTDLCPYLQIQNLIFSGINPELYEENKVLPEGFYTICIEAVDYWSSSQQEVSNLSCNQAWFILSDSPILNLPQCSGLVASSTYQDILFQWTPMHLSSPNLTGGTEYDLQLWEIFPDNADPNIIVQSLPPMFSITTDITFYNYSITDPPLVEGKEYIWRIRALELSGRDLFRNSGYSTLCTFRYGDPFSSLGNNVQIDLTARATSHRQIFLSWNTFSFFDEYLIQIRKSGSENWFELLADSGSLKINDLEPGTSYESRVRGLMPETEMTNWSEMVTCTTFQLPVYSCNDVNIIPDLLQHKPLLNATPGMMIRAGQFEMMLQNIAPGYSPGFYSGTGKIAVAFGLTLNVQFQSVYFSDNQTLIAGQVEALSDDIQNWANQWEYEDSYFFNGSIDSIFTNHGLVYIISENGDTTLITDYSGGLLITDANGNQWVVNPDGSVTPVEGGGLLPVSTTPLTEPERLILRAALLILKNEFTDQKLDSMRNALNNKENALDQVIQQQRSRFTDAGSEEGDVVFLGSSPEPHPNSQNTQPIHISYNTGETSYNEAKVLYYFTRELDTNEELNYIGKFLSVAGTPYKTFVAEQIAAGQTSDQIAWSVAENGVKALVKLVVMKKSGG